MAEREVWRTLGEGKGVDKEYVPPELQPTERGPVVAAGSSPPRVAPTITGLGGNG